MDSHDSHFLNEGFKFILNSPDLHSALTGLVKSAASLVGSDCASLYLVNKKLGVLEPHILVNFPEAYLAGCSTVPLGKQCCGRAALHKIPWIVEDMWTDPLFVDCREAAKAAGMRSGFSVPVLDADGECIGSLGCQFTHPYSPDVYAIERNRLFAQLIAFAVARQKKFHTPEYASTSKAAD